MSEIEAASLRRMMVLHTAYADLTRRTLYGARARGSNLLAHILDSLQPRNRQARRRRSGKTRRLGARDRGSRHESL
jgi:hypothetical protein